VSDYTVLVLRPPPKVLVLTRAGAPGPTGPAGRTVLSGSGAPSNAVGLEGDFWLDTATTVLYGPKGPATWPTPGVELIGPEGPEGPQGPQGPPGSGGGLGPGVTDGTRVLATITVSGGLISSITAGTNVAAESDLLDVAADLETINTLLSQALAGGFSGSAIAAT